LNTLQTFRPGSGFLLLAGFCLILLVSCKKEDSPDTVDCTGLTPTYNSDIKAILDASCAKSGCHDAATMANNYDLSTYASASTVSQNDRFLGAVQHKSGFSAMPQDGPKLSQDKIDLLTCWVQNGSPE
jgi:hypothetical protein